MNRTDWANDVDLQTVFDWLNDHWVQIAITSMTLAVSTAAMLLFNRIDYPARLFHRVDPTSSMDGGMLVAQVLQAHGVKCTFTLCGGHISTILVGCEKLGIRVIDVRHEATAVFAADAVARLTGKWCVMCLGHKSLAGLRLAASAGSAGLQSKGHLR